MTDFEFMMKIYGYAVDGRSDTSVLVSELRSAAPDYWLPDNVWDRDASYLKNVRVNGDMASELYALWWVCEHLRRYSGVIRED